MWYINIVVLCNLY